MSTRIGLAMLLHEKGRLAVSLAGIGVAFFLSASQVGVLVGWCRTNAQLIMHAEASVWVMARRTPAFDYGSPIPRARVREVRSVPGVVWAEGLLMTWNSWQRQDGRRVAVELVGLDASSAGGPWDLRSGSLDALRRPGNVVVDELGRDLLGAGEEADEGELSGLRARVVGVSRGIRTFTACPFVFSSAETAVKFDRRYAEDEVTFVLARGEEGAPPERLRDAIAAAVPDLEALTRDEFAARSAGYWMLETGAGITVVATAALGLLVGAFIASQFLYALAQEHRASYATLLALGFAPRALAGIVALQGLALGAGGVVLGGAGFAIASCLAESSPIPLETEPRVFLGLVLVALLSCVVAALAAARSVLAIDPVHVWRG